MRYCWILLTFICTRLYSQSAVYPLTGHLFDGNVHRIDLLLPADSVMKLTSENNRWSEAVYRCTFVFDYTDTVYSAAVRLRGNTSRNAERLSFKVVFDNVVNQTFRGLEELNLNGEHNDPSLVRTRLGYHVFSYAVPWALRTTHAELYFNGIYRGVYTVVEDADRTFLKSRFGHSNGSFFKCTWPADLTWKGGNVQVYKNIVNPSPLNQRAYELKTNRAADDYSGLVEFIRLINTTTMQQFEDTIADIFDVDAYLRVLAAEVLIGHWDNYYMNRNNYFLYFDIDRHKWIYIPYDPDNSFGIEWGIDDIATRHIHQWGNTSWSSSPLTHRLLSIENYRKQYEQALYDLITTVFNESLLYPLLDTLRNKLAGSVVRDPYFKGDWPSDYHFTYNNWLQSFEQGLGAHTGIGIKPYIYTRRLSALQQRQFHTSSVNDLSSFQALIYPNPAQGSFYVEWAILQEVQLYSASGQFIEAAKASAGMVRFEGLSPGFYMLKVTDSSFRSSVHKVLVY